MDARCHESKKQKASFVKASSFAMGSAAGVPKRLVYKNKKGGLGAVHVVCVAL